jgi:predicted dehydrogenase
MKPSLNLALVGAGFIGRSHALAIHAVNRTFPDVPLQAVPLILAELDARRAEEAAGRLGFQSWTANWEEAVDRADAVILATPSFMHMPIARRTLEQGKPLLCEKPVGLSAAQAAELAALAAAKSTPVAVGFTYTRLPLVRHAKHLIEGGTLGKVVHVRGRHAEDYLADPDAPHSWRLDAATAGRCGALGDLGYHIVAILRELCGPISGLSGISRTVHAQRPDPADGGRLRPVDNEDYAAAVVRFESGAVGTIEASRVAAGRKMDLSFEIVCERGTIAFDAERMNELQVYETGGEQASEGFRRILANPAHPGYAGFLPAPGHQIGFNDLKTIELKEFLEAVAAGRTAAPDLEDATRVSRLCEAILDSSESGCWIADPELYAGKVQ